VSHGTEPRVRRDRIGQDVHVEQRGGVSGVTAAGYLEEHALDRREGGNPAGQPLQCGRRTGRAHGSRR
jgi:hypothetical protein